MAAQAQESQARAQKLSAEAAVVPQELEIEKINAITKNLKDGTEDDKEFERRMRVAETLIKEKQVEGKTNVNDATRSPDASPINRQPTPAPTGPFGPTGNQGGGIM